MVANNVRRVLQIRLEHSQAATKKFNAIAARQHQGRMHDTLQAWGASRTGRWAGRGLQLQNLKRPTMRDPAAAADLLVSDPDLWGCFYNLEDLGSLVRSAIAASPGKALVVADLANIESRVLGWIANDVKLNRVFQAGLDPYKDFATHWLGLPYDQVDKTTRNLCKPPSLGCGYGLGPVGLVKYADSMGVPMDEKTAEDAVRAFRDTYRSVPALWRKLEGWWRLTLRGTDSGPMRLEGRFLTIRLPSGRKLYYDSPEEDDEGLWYLGQDQYTRQWTRLNTWGGKLVENVVQAIARDVLLHGMLLYEEAFGYIVGHVHDEIIAEEPEEEAQDWLRKMVDCMTETPAWAPGLRLDAEGYVSRRYRKG